VGTTGGVGGAARKHDLTLLIGRAGTGKTHHCHDSLAGDLRRNGAVAGAQLLFIVPEQATAQTERALLDHLGGAGAAYARAHVLSFRRLAHRILEEAGGAPRPAVNVLGKRMILRRVLEEIDARRGHFQESAGRRGFVDVIQRTLDEMRRYRVEPGMLREAAAGARGQGRATLADRLEEIARIAGAYHDRLARQFTDPEDLISLAALRIEESSLVRGASVWLDGFVGFTPQEYALFDVLLGAAGPVEVMLCLDPDLVEGSAAERAAGLESVFAPTLRTFERLRDAAERAGRAVKIVPLRTVHRFPAGSPLAAVEVWVAGGVAPVGAAEAIRFIEAPSRRGEVEAAAVECLRLCRDERYRFREIAVLVRDLDLYADLVSLIFREFDIPVFIDRRHSLAYHPLAVLLKSALDIAQGDGSPDPLLRYLKTDLVVPKEERREADHFERRVRERGLRGEALLHDAGSRLLPLRRLLDALRDGAPRAARDYARFIYQHLVELDAPKTLEQWSEETEGAPSDIEQERRAEGHRQVWTGVIDLMEQLVAAVPDDAIDLGAFAESFGAGLDALSEALPPPALECVLVGSVERSRHPEVRAAIVLGLNDGVFPFVRGGDSVLRDEDREFLQKAHIETAPTPADDLLNERYYFYIAATRARERLVLSQSATDEKGRPLAPSPFWTMARAASGAGPSGECDAWEAVLTPLRLAGAIASECRSADEDRRKTALEVYQAALARPDLREPLARVLPSVSPPAPERISARGVRAIYGESLVVSASQLTSYGNCPFQHFLRYGLRLEDPGDYEMDPRELGTILHDALRDFSETMRARGLAWHDAPAADRARMAAEALERAADRARGPEFWRNARNAERRRLLARDLGLLVEHLTRAAASGPFRPEAFEIGFGYEGSPLPAVELTLSDGRTVRLCGTIDRVDVATQDGEPVALALDYKSTARDLDAVDAAEGCELQLLVYLLALRRIGSARFGGAVKPAGAFYQPLRCGLLDGRNGEKAPAGGTDEFAKAVAAKLYARGIGDRRWLGENEYLDFARGVNLLREDALPGVLDAVERSLAGTCESILAGDCRVHPYDAGPGRRACTWCAFKAVCRFERARHPSRRPRFSDPEKAWAHLLGPEDAEGAPA